ncbi:sulfate/molybdate ABC transporter ATP-binding protein [Leifsonia poae]|uniref:Molybdenum ABC transporter ATP-binding protein n=1 Tax=Leifsonia poae TaxID=110933 RepID=A0A9W6HC83_9MICO|nr:ATP-binding cassette domain-containing protein [Leifsonia poae]GLJ77486.1 molybdenum ABC transporter ATP-binding protein [Leifsonia poae]
MSLTLEATVAERGVEVALELAEGETVAILGPNGAGKSTVLGVLAGLVRADTGRAVLGGDTLFASPGGVWTPPHRRGIALLAQEPLLFPHLSVRRNVEFGPRTARASRPEARARAEHWLGEVGAGEFADRHPAELSGGQAQRVAIARALAAEPRLLLLDEPLSALDVAVTSSVRQMLARVLDDRTAVIVSHDALDAYLLADRVVVLHEGTIAEQGATRSVLERPRHPFTAELTGVALLTGRRTPGGLVTDDGLAVAARAVETVRQDARVAAVVRPAEVRVESIHAPGVALADVNRVPATVLDLEPRGDLVRVRTDSLPALVPPAAVAELGLGPGVGIALVFPAAAVTMYNA